jgi:tetratricopeptide (TPR) repeat protein
LRKSIAARSANQEKCMRSTVTILVLALAPAAFHAAPAMAQYGGAPAQAPQQVRVPAPAPAPAEHKLNISKAAFKAISELKAAVDSNDVANIPAKLAAAQAVAQTSDEKYPVAQLQLKAAVASNNEAAMATALEAVIASGGVDQAQSLPLYLNLGRIAYKNKQYAKAAASFDRVLALDPAHTDAIILLAETRNSQGQVNDAVTLLQRAVQAKVAAGQKPEEAWYKRAVGLAYEAKLPNAVELSRKWVAAYPTPANWRDALRIYRLAGSLDDPSRLDALRLARATGALEGDADFQMLAYTASESSFPGEARAVIDEAIAAKKIDPNKPLFKDIVATLNSNRAMNRDALPQLAREAKAAPAAKLAVRTGDAYYGYGDFAQAAELYRAALTKTGADANFIQLHLGMALARAGDKAGATAALNAVTGPKAELAKFWLVYVATA